MYVLVRRVVIWRKHAQRASKSKMCSVILLSLQNILHERPVRFLHLRIIGCSTYTVALYSCIAFETRGSGDADIIGLSMQLSLSFMLYEKRIAQILRVKLAGTGDDIYANRSFCHDQISACTFVFCGELTADGDLMSARGRWLRRYAVVLCSDFQSS
jgi:hypothetical protein